MRAAQLARFAAAIMLVAAGALASTQGLTTSTLALSAAAARTVASSSTASGQGGLAQIAVFEGKYPSAIAPARRSLMRCPLDPPTLRSLAIAQIETGDHTGAARMLTLASQLGWRDTATQAFLLEIALRAGDAGAASIRFDALARQHHALAGLNAYMHRILLLPQGPDMLAGRLVARPAWRGRYLEATDNLPANLFGPWLAMFGALERRGAAVQPAEYSAFERALTAQGQIAAAIDASRKFGALRKSDAQGFGEIEQGAEVSPFVWSVEPGREAAVSQSARGSLSARVDGQAGGDLVRRVFPVTAGPHRLTLNIAEASDEADQAFGWAITCLPTGTLLEPVANQRQGPRGRVDEIAFVAPAGCIAVRIALASTAGEIRRDYTVTISALTLR